MRATRQEGSGEECRVALIATSEARRNCSRKPISLFCGGFYLKFELFSLKILNDFSLNEMRSRFATLFSFSSQSQKSGVGRHGRRGVGRNAVPSSALFLGRAVG